MVTLFLYSCVEMGNIQQLFITYKFREVLMSHWKRKLSDKMEWFYWKSRKCTSKEFNRGDEILYRRIIQNQDVGKPIKGSKGEKPKLEERSDNLSQLEIKLAWRGDNNSFLLGWGQREKMNWKVELKIIKD